jgi:choline kinase
MSDYHDLERPYHIAEDRYPTAAEQKTFIDGYVEHGCESFDDEDRMRLEAEDLLLQTRDWRPAVHIHWCVWGIVQAVPDESSEMKNREILDGESGYKFDLSAGEVIEKEGESDRRNVEDEEVEELEEPFDYIAYSTEKAQLFWSDLIKLGLLALDDYHGAVKNIKDDTN